jgi:hypothetical protein
MVYQTNRMTGKHTCNQYQKKLSRYNSRIIYKINDDYAFWRDISKPGN